MLPTASLRRLEKRWDGRLFHSHSPECEAPGKRGLGDLEVALEGALLLLREESSGQRVGDSLLHL